MSETIIIAILGSGLLSTIINQLCSFYQRKAEKKTGVNSALRLILKDRLRFLCVHYIQQGWIYEDELEDIITMHKCYHDDLKGNGYLDTLMNRVKSLEVRGVGV
nr:hypothetical protein [uncultured Agathobaculum sp.]